MKLFLFVFAIFFLINVSVCQSEDNDDIERDSPSVSSSILARARGGRALLGKPQASPKAPVDKLKKTTASNPSSPPPQNDADIVEDIPVGEEEEGDFNDDDVEASSAKPTEAPKKLGQGARPFRSNQDLLEALKRRREQRVYVPPPSTSTSFTPVQIPEKQPKQQRSKYATSKGNFSPSQEEVFDNSKKSSNSRNFKNKVTIPPPVEEEELEPTPAPKTGRAFGGRNRKL